MDETVQKLIDNFWKDIRQYISEDATPQERNWRARWALDMLLSKERQINEEYDSAFWHGELNRISKYNWQPLDASGKQINEEWGDSHA